MHAALARRGEHANPNPNPNPYPYPNPYPNPNRKAGAGMRSLFRGALCRGAPPEDGLASLTLTRTLTLT